MIRILIADDHFIVRAGLQKIIAEIPDMEIAAEACDGHEVLEKISQTRYDIVLLDISMPGPRGLDVLKTIKQQNPELPVLILSVHPEKQYAIRALKSGASGYLTKEKAGEELIAAIRKACSGGRYVSMELAEQMADALNRPQDHLPHENLSDREYSVMRMLAQGHSLNDIAEALYISPKTVSTYRTRILEKMNMKTNAEIIRYALSHGLINSDD